MNKWLNVVEFYRYCRGAAAGNESRYSSSLRSSPEHTHTHTDACIRFKRDVRALAGLNLLKSSHQLGIHSHERGAALRNCLSAAAIIGLLRLYHYYYYFNSPVIAGLCSGVGCMGGNKSPTINFSPAAFRLIQNAVIIDEGTG